MSLNRRLGWTCGVLALWVGSSLTWAQDAVLHTYKAGPALHAMAEPFEGRVEAVRQAVIAAQVAGAVVELGARVGDRVTANQVLLRLDAQAALQNAAAGDAQVRAAQAARDLAAADFTRQQRLYQQGYISQAAQERALAAYQATQATLHAQLAQARVAHAMRRHYEVRAPFAGVIAEVPVSVGDMALPGRALVTLYEPSALRVTAAVPQSVLGRLSTQAGARIELLNITGEGRQWLNAEGLQVLPTVDAMTHTVQLRAPMPVTVAGVKPGMFARLWLLSQPQAAGAASRVCVPHAAVVRRAEVNGLYVLNMQGQPMLRQVRLGRALEDCVEVLAGVAPAEQVVIDPQSAVRARWREADAQTGR
ncbi:efflux RND transporter periplasmic adaptor subunit [Sinimarinibacterium sp. NLF-5-8]|uniref:efflux RND transporter periplasmic adaptor subunit n=1 Tax=Sinimarinibacterium sp. NLF-5-8 TaxID=2698684 RepID=UPI00137C2593|nr:efflux RND transporter periplasmic adaptor subunit [Sinimarinibacterium sp. NLF-5-8]QHS10968.1 efflux RND transporter periplasmic adaptor subunit [Sinimarinibacterium sp. NLF-5-8]